MPRYSLRTLATKRQRFSLAFLFLQVFWIGVALRSVQLQIAAILHARASYAPIGFVGVLPSVVCASALGAFMGGIWGRTVAGAMLGCISVPALVAVLYLAAVLLDAAELSYGP
jgi:hypothetical protein